MISGICRSILLAGLALDASACTITLGTGTGAQQPPVYWVDSSGQATQAQPQPAVAQPAPLQVGGAPAPGPVPQPPTPVPATIVPPPRHVGVPGLTSRNGMPVLPRGSVFGGDGSTFAGSLYFIPVGTPRMPDFSSLPVQAVTSTDHLNIQLSNSQGSLPPWPDKVEGFGLEYKGTFAVTTPGTYTFTTYSDDGAIVFVDGAMVVNDDGVHNPQRADGKVSLTAGMHSVRIDYFLAYRWTVELQVFVVRPDGNQELFGPTL